MLAQYQDMLNPLVPTYDVSNHVSPSLSRRGFLSRLTALAILFHAFVMYDGRRYGHVRPSAKEDGTWWCCVLCSKVCESVCVVVWCVPPAHSLSLSCKCMH